VAERVVANGSSDPGARLSLVSEAQKAKILLELERILSSRTFQASKRSKQFLSYVIQHALQGHADSLKERTIGVELFQRAPAYLTGDDPVVRVKAGEVRRRLHQYYAEEAETPEVRIDIPVGSYIPEFHWSPDGTHGAARKSEAAAAWTPPSLMVAVTGVVALGAFLALAFLFTRSNTARPAAAPSALDQFWAPVVASSQPVLICLASPVVYRPSLDLYGQAPPQDRSKYQTEVERFNNLLDLKPDQTLRWKQMVPFTQFYVAKGDAYSAVQLSALFARLNKPSQFRVGDNYSFEDLHNSPAVLIGAFNNHWTLQMTANLPFVFAEQNGNGRLQERNPGGEAWSPVFDRNKNRVVDYGEVSRVLDSGTGQILITVAGVGPWGTQAAADFVSKDGFLAQGLQSAPAGWEKKNLEIVLRTNVFDSVPGPPQVVAARFW
jgi:hypothetical protein